MELQKATHHSLWGEGNAMKRSLQNGGDFGLRTFELWDPLKQLPRVYDQDDASPVGLLG